MNFLDPFPGVIEWCHAFARSSGEDAFGGVFDNFRSRSVRRTSSKYVMLSVNSVAYSSSDGSTASTGTPRDRAHSSAASIDGLGTRTSPNWVIALASAASEEVRGTTGSDAVPRKWSVSPVSSSNEIPTARADGSKSVSLATSGVTSPTRPRTVPTTRRAPDRRTVASITDSRDR